MSEHPRPFDEALLSGFLDGELTQAERQRVRLQLEADPATRKLFEELQQMREAARATRFRLPADDQWSELPRGIGSWLSRHLGWALLGTWLVGLVGFGAWQVATAESGVWLKLAIFAPSSGISLLFLSTLIDRLKTLPGDRYRRVLK